MANVVISGDTSGAITLAAPAVAGTNTLSLPAVTDTLVGLAATQTLTNKSIAATQLTGTIAAARLPAGSVLQVVSAAKTDTFTTSSSSFVDVTGLSVSITPTSATSKIFVLFQVNGGSNPAVQGVLMRLVRDSTAICVGDAASSRPRITASPTPFSEFGVVDAAGSFLDSPATTSSITYKVQILANGGAASACVNRSSADRDNPAFDPRTASTITVMEIAA
jgi:hypothetical protein